MAAMGSQGLTIPDYVIFSLMLVGTLSIGVYHAISSRKTATTAEYLMGGRNMNVLPVSISLMVSFISSILMLGFPAETYTNGGQYWLYALGMAVGALLAATIFIPVFHPLRLTSVNQYLKRRFHSTPVSILGTIFQATSMILYTATVYFAPATAIEAVTGFPIWGSIFIGSLITIVYTAIGGIKAVIWTDVFQTVIMVAGLMAVTIQAALQVGGLSSVWKTCSEWGRLPYLNFDPDPTQRFTFWSLSVGVGFMFLSLYGTTQTAVQRYSSLPTLTKASLCVFLALPWTTLMVSLACMAGLTIFAYYTQKGCDPLGAHFIDNPNQLVPYFITDTLNYPGIPGVFLAALCSASLSSASSALNSAAANIWDDILRKIWPNLSEQRNLLITKVLVVIFGIVATALAFVVSQMGGTIIQVIVTFMSATNGPTMAMFFMGVAFPFVNWIGAGAGGLSGFTFAMWMGFGSYAIKKHKIYLDAPVTNCSQYSSAWASNTTEITGTTIGSLMADLGDMTSEATMDPSTIGLQTDPVSNPLHRLYSVSYLWIALYSYVVAVTVGVLISLATGCMRGKYVDPIYLHPLIRRFAKRQPDDEKEVKNNFDNGKTEKSFDNPAFDMNNGMKSKENGLLKTATRF